MKSLTRKNINRSPRRAVGSTPAGKRAPLPSTPERIGAELGSPTRIFISYRRQDSAAAAAHLRASLARRFGASRVFLDLFTIEPGQDFVRMIEQAIAATSVVLVLIGPRWLNIKGANGRRRLDDPNDFVRLEIESALRQKVTVIPVLVDGATMPSRRELPTSMADLSTRDAYALLWHESVGKLGNRIAAVERERARRDAEMRARRARLDLTQGRRVSTSTYRSATGIASFSVVIRAMEISLARQGKKVKLSPKDLVESMREISEQDIEQLGFMPQDLVYVIDLLGIKAQRSNERYLARSLPLASLREVPAQLALGRPVLAQLQIYDSWFEKKTQKTGFVDGTNPGQILGAVMGAIVAWDPNNEEYKLLVPWPQWGKHGIGTLTRLAARQSILDEGLRAIEPALKPQPFHVNKPESETTRPRREHNKK